MRLDETVLVIIPPCGFPGEALLGVDERLRAHGNGRVVASQAAERCVSASGVSVTADYSWDDPALPRCAAIIVFDDAVGTVAQARAVKRLLAEAKAHGTPVGAVGRGVLAVAAAGLLNHGQVAAGGDVADAASERGIVVLKTLVAAWHNVLTATEEGAEELVDRLVEFKGVHLPEYPPET